MEAIIKNIVGDMIISMENECVKACQSYGFDVDKERLTQALTDARKFYDEGYADGKRDSVRHGRWIALGQRTYGGGRSYTHYCSECGQHGFDDYTRCPNCGAKMDGGGGE